MATCWRVLKDQTIRMLASESMVVDSNPACSSFSCLKSEAKNSKFCYFHILTWVRVIDNILSLVHYVNLYQKFTDNIAG